jgi:SAM-dependent methyltransferase
MGSRRFFELVEEHRYKTEWHIPAAADFEAARGLRVLEIGCGLGTDGARFARAGADYTGVDLTDAAVELAQKRFELFNLPGTFRTADAESLDFPDNSFDLVYSHGVLHHTPNTAGAIREAHRVLKPNGRAIVMLYHRDSYNYRVNIRVLRRGGMQLLKSAPGMRLINLLTGEPMESLREHAAKLADARGSVSEDQFLNQNTDGAGNPLARVYSVREAVELFKDFSEVKSKVFFLNKRFIPLLGKFMPRSLESSLAARWGWHLWIYARK